MMIFSISYTQSQYLESDSESLVVAEDFDEAIEKWKRKFSGVRNVRMTGIKVFWEFPIV